MLAQVITEQRQTNLLLLRSMSKPEAAMPKLVAVPVPETVYQKLMEQARLEERLRKHESLVGRLLGDRAKK